MDPTKVAQTVCQGVYKGVTTSELDELAAETAVTMTSIHPDYARLAARIVVSNLHKSTKKCWTDVIEDLYRYVDKKSGRPASLIGMEAYQFIMTNKDRFNGAIVHDRDDGYDYFGFKTLERSYLLKLGGTIVERPQHMLMRVACGIHLGNVDAAIETYNLMSERWFTHASPTLFNACTPKPQLSSCFLLTMADDSIEGIYDTLKQCAMISKCAGGIGLSVHTIRASGSYIRGTNGTSNGLVPMLRVFNNTARYVDQGGGKRPGTIAIYVEPWHADIMAVLDLKKNHGSEEVRARDLFYALWVPDLFMTRVDNDQLWSLMCPNECPGLCDVHSEAFNALYEKYEREGKFRKQVKARDVWQAILVSQLETGTPYILYKDACNAKSNQKNVGTIRSSNLCTEVIEYSSPTETAVCNLASIALPKFVTAKGFDHQRLFEVTAIVTRNLNKIIDVNHYPIESARRSNLRHRPIGIGVQGLADTFLLLRLPFDSAGAKALNRDIFETMYFAALTASNELAATFGPYETYAGSPASKGILQYDMWKIKPGSRWDWTALKTKIAATGLRNSLLLAPMPTASTSQILGNNECFEPYSSNIGTRRTSAGEFVCVNRHLLNDLIRLKLWSPALKDKLIAHNGSVQTIDEIPKDLKLLYRTVWEISARDLIDMAADRGAFIDQSQSFNVHMPDATFKKLTSMHFYGWRKGLKTGMYYLRTKAAADAVKVTVTPTDVSKASSASSAAGLPVPLTTTFITPRSWTLSTAPDVKTSSFGLLLDSAATQSAATQSATTQSATTQSATTQSATTSTTLAASSSTASGSMVAPILIGTSISVPSTSESSRRDHKTCVIPSPIDSDSDESVVASPISTLSTVTKPDTKSCNDAIPWFSNLTQPVPQFRPPAASCPVRTDGGVTDGCESCGS